MALLRRDRIEPGRNMAAFKPLFLAFPANLLGLKQHPFHGAHAPVEEPSTASKADIPQFTRSPGGSKSLMVDSLQSIAPI